MLLLPILTGIAAGILMQLRWHPLSHWYAYLVAAVCLAWVLDPLLTRAVSRSELQRIAHGDYLVASAMSRPELLVEALEHLERFVRDCPFDSIRYSSRNGRTRR